LTISDLNRHAFDAMPYSLLVVKAALARLMEQHFADAQAWISLLNEDQQAWVLGFWELS
jgi:hypothetical protein